MNKENKRRDAKNNKVKVIKSLIKNPMQSIPEIAKDTWLSVWNVHNKLKDVEKNGAKSDIIDGIIKKDAEIVKLAQAELEKRIKKNPAKVSTRDIISAWDVSAKRYMIFKWDATDKEWGLKGISDITINIWE